MVGERRSRHPAGASTAITTPRPRPTLLRSLMSYRDAGFTNHVDIVSLQGFTVIGSQFQVNLTDGTHQGPYSLPIVSFRRWASG
jgi:hypothetical protein